MDAAVQAAAKGRYAFEALPAVRLKGKAKKVPLFRPTGECAHGEGAAPLLDVLQVRLSSDRLQVRVYWTL